MDERACDVCGTTKDTMTDGTVWRCQRHITEAKDNAALREELAAARQVAETIGALDSQRAAEVDVLREELARVKRATGDLSVALSIAREKCDALREELERTRATLTLTDTKLLEALHREERLREALVYIAGFVGLDPEHRVRVVARAALSEKGET